MAEQFTNSFIKGLNQDMATTAQPNSTYRDARNIRVTTDTGRTNGAVINAEGNEFSFDIPLASTTWEITCVDDSAILDVDIILTIQAPGPTSALNPAIIPISGTTINGTITEKLLIIENALKDYLGDYNK